MVIVNKYRLYDVLRFFAHKHCHNNASSQIFVCVSCVLAIPMTQSVIQEILQTKWYFLKGVTTVVIEIGETTFEYNSSTNHNSKKLPQQSIPRPRKQQLPEQLSALKKERKSLRKMHFSL